jgi:hypothetical protein
MDKAWCRSSGKRNWCEKRGKLGTQSKGKKRREERSKPVHRERLGEREIYPL